MVLSNGIYFPFCYKCVLKWYKKLFFTVVHLWKIDLQKLSFPSTEKLSIYLHKSVIVSLLSALFECWDVGSFVLMMYIMYSVQTNVQFLANES